MKNLIIKVNRTDEESNEETEIYVIDKWEIDKATDSIAEFPKSFKEFTGKITEDYIKQKG